MKLISLGKIDKKFFVYLLLNIIIEIILNLIDKYFRDNSRYVLVNLPLIEIINFGFCLFFGIPELIIKIKYLNIKNENNENKNERNIENIINAENNIDYIYNNPYNPKKCKNFFILVLVIIVYYIFDLLFNYIYLKFQFNEKFLFMQMIYFYLIFLCHKTTRFYRHQKLSIIIIILFGALRHILLIRFFRELKNTIPILFFLLFLSFEEPLLYYILKNICNLNFILHFLFVF